MFGLFGNRKRDYEAKIHETLEVEVNFSTIVGGHAPGILRFNEYVDNFYSSGIHPDEAVVILVATAYSGLLKINEKDLGDTIGKKLAAWLHKTNNPPNVSLNLFNTALKLMTDACKAYYDKQVRYVPPPGVKVNPERAVWPEYYMRKN